MKSFGWTRYLALLILTVFVVLTIPYFQRVVVHNDAELSAYSCGWPLHFVTLDGSWQNPPYPWNVDCSPIRGYDTTATYDWMNFIANVAIFYAVIVALYWLKRLFHERAK